MKKQKKTSILTRKATAEYLSISLATLRVWTVKGFLKAYQIGGRIYYKENEILESMKSVDNKLE